MTSPITTTPLAFERFAMMAYIATPAFRCIDAHTAVARPDGALIAVTGPAGDPESEAHARLFAAAPDLLRACEQALWLLNEYGAACAVGGGIDLREVLRAAIDAAHGSTPDADRTVSPSVQESH